METSQQDRYDKRMNHDQLDHYIAFFEDAKVHMEIGFDSELKAIDSLQAIAFDAIMTIEKIKRDA